jgi:hypothetical protein
MCFSLQGYKTALGVGNIRINETLFHNIDRDCTYLSIGSLIDVSVYTGPVVPDNGNEMAVSCP